MPLPFAYIVGERGVPVETWGQEANLFHNPKAKHPISVDLFDTVANSQILDGQYVDSFKDDFKPIMSISHSIHGPDHRQIAKDIADRRFASMQQALIDTSEHTADESRSAD